MNFGIGSAFSKGPGPGPGPLCKAWHEKECIVIICFPVWDVQNFENSLGFLMKSFLFKTKKVRAKIWVSSEIKDLFRWNEKHFSSFI